ncbi:IclR family transcriptional regulator [Sabulicella glaciei]|uniref:Helix-turn-helix domain-containing protein n=1 Tax=Sabulicella glaciei TaxID=2984948 RepID=A0ABT3NRG4_9PROT|nr:helix-turn-helix domain-containing protein [Roseococcus sp. MDT2-1-1]
MATGDDPAELKRGTTLAERGAGSIGRILEILDLFTEEHPVVRVEDLMARRDYTRSTAYRYVKALSDAGLVAPVGNGFYALGPRIVELERLMHMTDPLLQAAEAVLPDLAEAVPNSIVLLCSLYRDKVLCVLKAGPGSIHAEGRDIQILRARGLPLPLFRGAASLAILAFLPPHRIRSLYLDRQADIAEAGLGATWPEVRSRLAAIRRDGHMTTVGQFNPDLAAVAVPVLSRDRSEVVASLTRILARHDFGPDFHHGEVQALKEGAARLAARMP